MALNLGPQAAILNGSKIASTQNSDASPGIELFVTCLDCSDSVARW